MLQLDKSKLDKLNQKHQLAQRHAQEWQAIFELEIQTRHAIAYRHKQETTDIISQTSNPLDRSKLLLKHTNELTQLKCSNHLKRQALQEKQEQEKVDSSEPV